MSAAHRRAGSGEALRTCRRTSKTQAPWFFILVRMTERGWVSGRKNRLGLMWLT